MALIDVYNAVNKTTDPPGRFPTHDTVAIIALLFRGHITANEAETKLNTLLETPVTTAEKDGLADLKATYDAKVGDAAKVFFLMDMHEVFHLVERGVLTAQEAGTILS